MDDTDSLRLSVVIPCFNEEDTLELCVERVLAIADDSLSLELIIVDDCSTDSSIEIARQLEKRHKEIRVFRHSLNQGKGAALKTAFSNVSGDVVVVQDADLEYDPQDIPRLLVPFRKNSADAVFGSRFLPHGAHRVLYFWHYLGNRFLTFVSNMFTDLNLTDMETCYKLFRRSVIQSIDIKESRFGFEPEVVAKIAEMRLRIYEMGISYHGRTYQEGKKIGAKDGFRALYCILRYNAHNAPLPIQVALYTLIGGAAAIVNLLVFLLLNQTALPPSVTIPSAFCTAALVNYLLCVLLLFRHKAYWGGAAEVAVYAGVVAAAATMDFLITMALLDAGITPMVSKSIASLAVFILNFAGRRFVVFPEKARKPWAPGSR